MMDKSMILMIANIHNVFRGNLVVSRFTENAPARTGSQEVASSILASSTNKINNLAQITKLKKASG
jgi:hypothetical protein